MLVWGWWPWIVTRSAACPVTMSSVARMRMARRQTSRLPIPVQQPRDGTATFAAVAPVHVRALAVSAVQRQAIGWSLASLPRPSSALSSSSLSASFLLRRHASSLSLSARERSVLRLLQSIKHPSASNGEDIVFSGHVRSVSERNGAVSIVLPLDDAYRALKRQITERLEAADTRPDWLQGVRVVMEAAKSGDSAAASGSRTAGKHDGLAQVRHIIAVSSCKGGVGKSTVAVNLAYALQKLQVEDAASGDAAGSGPRLRDLRVGLLDADIYGPSLPTMVSPRDTTLRYDDARRIVPPVYEGIKTMSYGYVKSSQQQQQQKQTAASGVGSAAADAASSGAFIRGPLASAAVKQLASETDWGALDYLIVDMPPGTGDIQLTLTQLLGFRAAVVVTTPGKLAFVDVVKGLDLFERVRVPVLAVVENMSYFMCDNCDTKHRLFGDQGRQHLDDLQTKFGRKKIVEMPIWKQMAKASDSGDPFMLSHDPVSAPVRALYEDLAASIHRDISQPGGAMQQHAAIPTLTYDAATGRVTLRDNVESPAAATATAAASAPSAVPAASPSGTDIELSARSLRLACQCAGCVDELSGVSKLDPRRVPSDVRPIGMQPRGNYAVAVHWSDGHASSIYPFAAIRKLADTQTAN